jgi:hypothetical protein
VPVTVTRCVPRQVTRQIPVTTTVMVPVESVLPSAQEVAPTGQSASPQS